MFRHFLYVLRVYSELLIVILREVYVYLTYFLITFVYLCIILVKNLSKFEKF